MKIGVLRQDIQTRLAVEAGIKMILAVEAGYTDVTSSRGRI